MQPDDFVNAHAKQLGEWPLPAHRRNFHRSGSRRPDSQTEE
jgi:hypothetical protein